MVNIKQKIKSIIEITALCVVCNTEMNAAICQYNDRVIHDNQFADNTEYTEIICPNVIYVGMNAFANSSIENVVFRLGTNVTLAPRAFQNARNLSNIQICTHSIPESCFSGCENLQVIKVHDVQQIGQNAFYGCRNLFHVVFSQQLNFVAATAFNNSEIQPNGYCFIPEQFKNLLPWRNPYLFWGGNPMEWINRPNNNHTEIENEDFMSEEDEDSSWEETMSED